MAEARATPVLSPGEKQGTGPCRRWRRAGRDELLPWACPVLALPLGSLPQMPVQLQDLKGFGWVSRDPAHGTARLVAILALTICGRGVGRGSSECAWEQLTRRALAHSGHLPRCWEEAEAQGQEGPALAPMRRWRRACGWARPRL